LLKAELLAFVVKGKEFMGETFQFKQGYIETTHFEQFVTI
jgi:hypothetical protein